MTDRITAGLRFMAIEGSSCSREEFRRGNQPAGDMLLTALHTGGYVRTHGEQLALSEQGLRRLKACDRDAPEEAEVE